MKALYAILVYTVMGLILTLAMVLAMNGKPILLVISVLGYVALFTKFGCLTHE